MLFLSLFETWPSIIEAILPKIVTNTQHQIREFSEGHASNIHSLDHEAEMYLVFRFFFF